MEINAQHYSPCYTNYNKVNAFRMLPRKNLKLSLFGSQNQG